MKSRANIKKIIIGAGNILLSDEGLGIHILKELEKAKDFSPGSNCGTGNSWLSDTSFVDIGTSSIDIGLHLGPDAEKVVIIDCMNTPDFMPGTVFRLNLEDLRKRQAKSFSLHQMELADSLRLLSITGSLPQIMIIGVVPDKMDVFSLELSETLKSKFPGIMKK